MTCPYCRSKKFDRTHEPPYPNFVLYRCAGCKRYIAKTKENR